MICEAMTMRSFRRGSNLLFVALLLLSAATAGQAAGPDRHKQFLDGLAAAYSHYRGAFSYLRTGNGALAALEIEQAQSLWQDLVARYADAPPEAFAADPEWRPTLERMTTALARSLAQTDAGDLEAARRTLAPLRGDLAALRQRNNVTTFSEQIDDLSAAMEALWLYRHAPPDFAAPETARELASRTAVFTHMLLRARETAPPAIAESAEFQRLVAGDSVNGAEKFTRFLAESIQHLWPDLGKDS